MSKSIKAIDKSSIHRITSGQVVIDLQNAVKELLENSLDAGATSIDVRFYKYGLNSIEVMDNGCGMAEEDHESIALKHYTSKLEDYEDLTTMSTFGFRGEALSSLCALCEKVTVSTATSSTSPRGTSLVMDSTGRVKTKNMTARQQGTTVTLTKLFAFLPVRRKEFERNIKREYGKALSLLTAYALGPCSARSGVRLTVSNHLEKGQKTVQIKTLGSTGSRSSITELWGPKALDNIVDLEIRFEFEREKSTLKRVQTQNNSPVPVQVKGLISKFAIGCGRTGTDRQFFYVNGRPCNLHLIQKAMNEVYRTFNANQAPFILADLIIPTDVYDVNVSPDKRTILIHHEGNLITELKAALETSFSAARSTYEVEAGTQSQSQLPQRRESRTTVCSADDRDERGNSPRPSSNPTNLDPPISPLAVTISDTALERQPTRQTSTVPSTADRAACSIGSNDDQTESMDVDDDGVTSHTRRTSSPTVILHTSQTSWGKRLDVPTRSTSPMSTPSPPQPISNDSEEREPAKKKHRSLIDHDTGMEEVTAGAAENRSEPGIKKPTTTRAALKQSSLKNYISSNKLRTRLESFAMPGSQVAVSTLPNVDEDEVMANNTNDEVDELGEDSWPVEREENDVDDVDSLLTREPSPPQQNVPGGDKELVPETQSANHPIDDNDDEPDDPSSILSQARATSSGTPSTLSTKSRVIHPEIIKSSASEADITLRIDLKKMRHVWSQERNEAPEPEIRTDEMYTIPSDAGLSNADDDEKAIAALSRVIAKQDFESMDVVGQFNLGFVIVRRCSGNKMDDLFIVDQHAADEKYNFETLQETTKIESQKLFRPHYLEFTAADEMMALENLDVLRQNGFEIEVDEEVDPEESRRLKLLSIPVSKSIVFDVKDLEEIVYLLHDRPNGQMVRCSKAKAMFASRACRKSVMIGMPLNQAQMKTVIRHMGTMDQPWNCPHGRPTMRHLSDIRTTCLKSREKIDWSLF